MADTYDYGLTYAGVPFLTDVGHSGPRYLPADQQRAASGRLHSPDLWMEINKKLDLRYLQDYTLQPNYPGRNLGAVAFRPQIGPQPSPSPDQCKLGDYYYPFGTTRWSVFRGLMTSQMVKKVTANTFGGTIPAFFSMKMVPQGLPDVLSPQYRISTPLYLLPPRPIAEHGGTEDGLYLVTLIDERFYMQGDPCTLRPTGTGTWADLINAAAVQLDIDLDYDAIPAVYGRPEPDSHLWANYENAAVLLDALAFNVGRVVVRRLDGSYTLLSPEDSRASALANRGSILRLIRSAGGDLFASGGNIPAGNLTPNRNSVVPREVWVTHPKYVEGDDPVPHFLNPRTTSGRPSCWYEESYGDVHVNQIPVASGGPFCSGLSGVYVQTIHNTAKAYYSTEAQAVSGGTPSNASGLLALDLQLARDYYDTQVALALDEVYPGIYAWDPEGTHDVIWTYSHRAGGAFTRVMKTEWNNYPDVMQHGVPDSSGSYTARGVGGPSVAQTWRGLSILGSGALSGFPLSGLLSGTLLGINQLYGVNLVTVGSGLILSPGTQTSGGVSEAVLRAEATFASGVVQSGQPLVLLTTVRDSYGMLSGAPDARLTSGLESGVLVMTLQDASYFPTYNRWRASINSGLGSLQEDVLLEGTSGGTTITIVARGIDGTRQQAHLSGARVNWTFPDVVSGTQPATFGPGYFVFPGSGYVSGGATEAIILCPIRTVQVKSQSVVTLGGRPCYSGAVQEFSPWETASWKDQETVWVVERNDQLPYSGKRYPAQLVGFSERQPSVTSGKSAPVYLITEDAAGGLTFSGFYVSDWQCTESGYLVVKRGRNYLNGVLQADFSAFSTFYGCDCCTSGSAVSGGGGGGSPSIDTDCCPDDLLPETLYVTFGGTMASMGTISVTWNPSEGTWKRLDINGCGTTQGVLTVNCQANGTQFGVSYGTQYSAAAVPSSCNPLLVETAGTNILATCAGAATADVTETPP